MVTVKKWCRPAVAMLLIVGMSGLSLGATLSAGTHVPPAAKHVAGPHVNSIHLANTHLHGAKPAITKTVKTKKLRHAVSRWSFEHWAALHRGTGTIVGQVTAKSGQPVGGVTVGLRTAKGRMFRRASAKHITSTNASGRFVMRNVRLGSYRVRAHKAKSSGHAQLHLNGGQTSVVDVKM